MKEMSFSEAVDSILAGRLVEFPYHDAAYLIQRENNKGYNYLSLWRTEPDYVCLGRAFFDLWDGVSRETVEELFSLPCLEGRVLGEVLEEIFNTDAPG